MAPNRSTVGLASLYEQVARAVYEDRSPQSLQPAQWSTLRFFDRAGPKARTVTGLARYLNVTPGPASRAANALERRGLVEARQNPDDGRSLLFDLTDAGRRQLEEDPILGFAEALEELDDADRAAFQRVVLELSEKLGRRQKGA